MSSRSAQPQKQPVFQGLIKKNANVPFIFLNDEFLMKLSPLCRVSDIKKEIASLVATGDNERLSKFISTVFDNPNVMYIDGIAYVMNTVIPTSVIESRLDTEVVRRIQERDIQNSDKDVKEMLNYAVTLLHSQQKTNADVITAMDYAREGISFAVLKVGASGNETSALYATKYVPSYRIRYQSVDPNPAERKRKSGVWQFPECMIAARVIKIVKSPGDRDWKIGLERAASVVHPSVYHNMYIMHGNGICTSPMSGSTTERKIMELDDFIAVCFYFLKQVEFIITKGYHENSSPAAGQLYDAQYDKFRVKRHGSEIATCDTCTQSGSCRGGCAPITIEEETSIWVEHQKRMAENEVAGSLEATRGVTKKIRDRS